MYGSAAGPKVQTSQPLASCVRYLRASVGSDAELQSLLGRFCAGDRNKAESVQVDLQRDAAPADLTVSVRVEADSFPQTPEQADALPRPQGSTG